MSDDYLGPEPTRDETADQVLGHWDRTTQQRNRYRDALRKIAAWQEYRENIGEEYTELQRQTAYETGANDMLATLKQMAEEALK